MTENNYLYYKNTKVKKQIFVKIKNNNKISRCINTKIFIPDKGTQKDFKDSWIISNKINLLYGDKNVDKLIGERFSDDTNIDKSHKIFQIFFIL